MTNKHRTTLLRFCVTLMLASLTTLAAPSFAATKSEAKKSTASSAKVSKKTVTKTVTKKSTKKAAAKEPMEDYGPGAFLGQYVKRANFKQETPSQEARLMADWIVDSGNNQNVPFVIIDKKDAKVYVFHHHGGLRGAAPVLLGITVGDDSFPGVGNKPLAEVKPEEKTTPAGRYVGASDKNIKGADIIWIDYAGAVSLHAVVKGTELERRADRLASPLASERRISFGCVNAPVSFFHNVVLPAFKKTDGIVYVMPEVRSKTQVFAAYYDVDVRERQLAAANTDDPIAKFAISK